MMTRMYGFNGPGFCDVGLVLGGSRGKSVSLSFPASRNCLHSLASGLLSSSKPGMAGQAVFPLHHSDTNLSAIPLHI